MNQNKVGITSRLGTDYSKNLILFAVFCFFIVFIILFVESGSVATDYFAYWSVGKIADQKGFSEIYDLEDLHISQLKALDELGVKKTDEILISPIPVSYLSFFLLPFKYLSRFELIYSYRIWTFLNLAVLIGYLVFFLGRINPGGRSKNIDLILIILMLVSSPVLFNITDGQVEVFLLVCAGEFIRYCVAKKPLISGIWLAGMLLKPQLLILVIPIFLIKRNWKLLGGFFVASGIILLASFSLSGFTGFTALVNLWIEQSGELLFTFPEYMMNWRMVGVNINALMNTSFGWVIAGLGMVLTILAVYVLIRRNPPFGSPAWVMTMLGIFSATLAITWHAHAHMAMILIPFLMYASINKLLPNKLIFLWGITSFGIHIIDLFVSYIMKINFSGYARIPVAFSALLINLAILFSTLKIKESQHETLVESPK